MEKAELGAHILSRYNEELERLRTDVLHMGGLAESQVQIALRSLSEGNAALASEVVRNEARVNQYEVDIDNECNRILATRAPTASDLRLVVAMIKTITDIERVGDEAHKIAHISMRHSGLDRGLSDGYRVVRHLGRTVLEHLHEQAAIATVRRDRAVDEEFDAVQRQCITFMIEDPRTIRASIDLLWIARALERVGDHAKNMCEYVIYMVGGRDVRHTSLADVEVALKASLARQAGGAGPSAQPGQPGGAAPRDGA